MNKKANQQNEAGGGKAAIDNELKKQILAVRDTGRTNMLQISNVQRIAYEMELFELVVFLDNRENHRAYVDFIMNGKR